MSTMSFILSVYGMNTVAYDLLNYLLYACLGTVYFLKTSRSELSELSCLDHVFGGILTLLKLFSVIVLWFGYILCFTSFGDRLDGSPWFYKRSFDLLFRRLKVILFHVCDSYPH